MITIEGRNFIPISERPRTLVKPDLGAFPTLTIKDDDLFLITDPLGNISSSGSLLEGESVSTGLFCRDTRFLSCLDLQIDGKSPILLSSDAEKGSQLYVLCANPSLGDIKVETIGIEREIVLNGGLFEEITITNYNSRNRAVFKLSLSFGADFADLFEIRGFNREKYGTLLCPSESETPKSDNPEIILAYLGLDGLLVESRLQFNTIPPDQLEGTTASWFLELEPHTTIKLGYRLQPFINNKPVSSIAAPLTLTQAKAAELLEEQSWYQNIARIRTDNSYINRVIEQAERDIFQLRQTFNDRKVLAAGVPWFSTLFGRDSLIGASQTLILDSSIAKETLLLLAYYQGQEYENWREEEPGKILHEIRFGEMARCHEIPHTPYYGTIDATPLWLMLYAEYYAWTRDWELLEQLWPNALAAMDWIDVNLKETGYLAYNRRSSKGLVNQGWKDSADCIVDRKGNIAEGAIALCEVQAYIYAAKIRLSELARLKNLPELAERWQQQARELKTRFNRDFWVPDLHYCALALDGEGKQVDSISSNPGQCLHLGIFDPEKAESVAERLQASDLFNGWGIRTLSSLSPAYNPMGYHLGSVWPHDNSLIVLGLRSQGFIEQALEVAQGLFDMTLEQPLQRPPELFCGYDRLPHKQPVRYPVACSPQAWATGSIFQLLQTAINLVPDAPNNYLRIIDPALLPSLNHISIENLQVGGTTLSLEFDRNQNTIATRVTKKRGNLRVAIES